MLRQLQKKASFEKEGSKQSPIFGHPDVHRLLKDLVKQEAEQPHTQETLVFSTKLASMLMKNLEDVLSSRAVFILVEFTEHANTAELIMDELKAKKKAVAKLAKEMPASKGLQILLGKI